VEKRAIQSKFNNGKIDDAVVVRNRESSILGGGYYFVITFFDGKTEIELTRQRGGARKFAELYAAANVIEAVGLKSFTVVFGK
jgi:hypothetical protein